MANRSSLPTISADDVKNEKGETKSRFISQANRQKNILCSKKINEVNN